MSPNATQTAPARAELQAPMTDEQGWKTVEAPELFSFDRPGQEIAGVLTSVTQVEVQGKRVTQFILSAETRSVKLLATYDLLQKITRAHVGCMVRIKYRGDDPTVQKNGNSMKVFHVMTKGTPSHGAPSLPISDEDIPF